MKNVYFLLMIMLLSGCAAAKKANVTPSEKAMRYYESAREAFAENDLEKAEDMLIKTIKADGSYAEAYQALAQLYLDNGRTEEAIDLYVQSLEIEPEAYPDGYRIIAGIAFDAGQYERADSLIDKFLSFPPEKVSRYETGQKIKEYCEFALEALEHPVPFQPENMGDSINSDLYEYWPSLSVDEQVLYFTVLLTPAPELLHEDFFYSTFSDGHWTKRKNLGPPINTFDNEGAQSITADGQNLYFTACNRPDGLGKCDIYYSRLENGKWTPPVNLGSPVNTSSSDKHPAISADGRTLYFCSDRRGGKGGYDLWVSHRAGKKWSKPVNLGDSINTPGTEQSPFIHADQQTLYFSSDGWPGMGKGDLFKSTRTDTLSWTTPENLGYPINTFNDEVGMIVNAKGNRAYFASNVLTGEDTDIYTFTMQDVMRPVPVSYMKGRVYDADNFRGLEAVIQLIDIETEAVIMELESNAGEGEYLVSLPTDRDYALNVSRPGYLFYSEHFEFRGEHTSIDPFIRDVPLQPVKTGKSIILNNIFYDTDSYELLPESRAELNKLYEFMKGSGDVKVEISGHTDNTGTPEYNKELSEKRAASVVNYLIERGISPDRLVSAGYGEERPVADNNTESGKARNRRTELTIISN